MNHEKIVKTFGMKPPEKYRDVVENGGRIECLEYETSSYDEKELQLTKTLNVYLPKEYDGTADKKYNIFYLMHGGGENQNTLFGGPGQNSELKNIMDHMIENHDIEPMIIVTPTFYVADNPDASNLVRNFYHELVQDILPLVEQHYHTYAEGISLEDFKTSREHRAFGGFSMGAACTWYIFSHCLDYFKYYMPLSGDCWQYADKGGAVMPRETAEFLAEVVCKSGYGKEDYYIFCTTGSEDIAYPNMVPQLEEMKLIKDVFVFTPDGNNGNLCFAVTEGTTHWWHYVYDYIYHSLPYFFDR